MESRGYGFRKSQIFDRFEPTKTETKFSIERASNGFFF